MKKKYICLIISGLFFLCYSPLSVLADSDGSLQLNSDIITTQSDGEGGTSDFAIRAQLFSKELTEKTREKAISDANVSSHVLDINFANRHVNKLYQENYQQLKTELFKNYSQAHIDTTETKASSEKNSLLLLLVLALPLMILTGVVSRNWTRRKRRR